jgi:rifampin ADP-ribosylating transferase
MISIIVAVSDDWGIGKNNDLLWNIPEDMKRFKRLTTGKAVIMGKKTWYSLPRRPLPNRTNIVITDVPGEVIEGAVTAYSIQDAIDKCNNSEENFIIGGGSIYRQFLPFADQLYITHVHKTTPADIYFPEIGDGWEKIEIQEFPATEDYPAYTYIVYRKSGQIFYHGTKADLKTGDLIEPGYNSNYGNRKKAAWVYLTATLNAATWGAELAQGEGIGRIYIVEPTGPIEDDPNLTDKKFPGNPTKSYRTKHALKVTGEVKDWKGHSPEELKAMNDHLEKLKELGIEAIED